MAQKEQGKGYIGKIANSGTQNIQAPHQQKPGHKGSVKTGKDLRTGK